MRGNLLINDCSDNELVNRILAGELTAQSELDRRWRCRVLALAREILHDEHLAEDAAQITLWRVFQHLQSYDPARPFEKYILAIGRHAALDMLRRGKARRLVSGQEGLEELPEDGEEVQAQTVRAEELKALGQCLGTLRREGHRQAVILKMTGLSLSQIGEALHEGKRRVQSWLESSLEHLRRCMEGRGFADS